MTDANAAEWLRKDRVLPRYKGIECLQFPADLWRYGELIWEYRPPFVIEIGAHKGGTALFLADQMTDGIVISVEIDRTIPLVAHDRIWHVQASSTHPRVVAAIRERAGTGRGILLLDGDHSAATVEQELGLYAPLADYVVVQDTIMHWLPGATGNNPHAALARWLPQHPEFIPDPDPVPGPTQHPGGWLRRVTGNGA